jgi:DNA-directed RNA polymerase specialized sigma24 family protein
MVDDVRSIADPAERAKRAQELQREAQSARKQLAEIRREAVLEMRAGGMSHAEVAAKLEITRGTAQSIAEGRSLAKAESADAEGPDASQRPARSTS